MIETMDEPEETLDLVDSSDQVIGRIARQEVLSLEESGKGFARAVGVLVINSRGQLWLPRRQPHKAIAPGGLDFSTGEHVGAGESYDDAALRGLREELGIEPQADRLETVGDVPPFAGMPYFHKIYLYPADSVPHFNPQDFSGFEWLDPAETVSRLEHGEPAKEILLPSLELLINQHNQEGKQQ